MKQRQSLVWQKQSLLRYLQLPLMGLILALLVAGAVGCRSTKIIRKAMGVQHKDSTQLETIPADSMKTSTMAPVDLRADSQRLIDKALAGLEANKIDFTSFSGKIKVNYEGGDGNGSDFTAYIHIRKDSMIWISVNAVLGIEAFRMLITPDSVKILDRLKHVVRLRSVSFLQQEIHLPVDFSSLQDLLIGNPIFLDTASVQYYNKEQNGLSLMSVGNLFRNYITLNQGDNTLQHSKLDNVDPQRALTCDLTYGDYESKGSTHFSTYRKISVAEKSKLDIEMSYKQYNFNEELSFTFSIPKNYKRK
jgi:hypothetical protein